jgi:hypothetical protein
LPPGNGLLLWFEIDDMDAAITRAEAMGAHVIMPRHRNPPAGDGGPNHWEIWLRDLDGYKGKRSPQPFLTRPVSWMDFVGEVLFLQENGDGAWYTFAEGKRVA